MLTTSTVHPVRLQFPARSRVRTMMVKFPLFQVLTSIVALKSHTTPLGATVIAVPFPAPGSAPTNHSPATMGEAASEPVAVKAMSVIPFVGLGFANTLLTMGSVLSTTRIVLLVVPQFPAESFA